MAAPPNEPPTLKFAYQMELEVDDPAVVPNGPKGTRICIPVFGGRFKGANPDFHGEIAPSVDFAIGHSDGSGITLKVSVVSMREVRILLFSPSSSSHCKIILCRCN